jgi:hypothetical protein
MGNQELVRGLVKGGHDPKIPDDEYSHYFDERSEELPEDAVYSKTSPLRQVWNRIREFFSGLGDSIASAWSAVRHAFSSEHQANKALRNIHDGSVTEKPETIGQLQQLAAPDIPERTRVSTTDSRSDHLAGAPSFADSQSETHSTDKTGDASANQSLRNDGAVHDIENRAEALADPDDETAFTLFVSDFRQAQKEGAVFNGVGRQQFEDAAVKHAQKLYDAEVARFDALGDRFADYALSSEQALKIQVASALLKKPLPHQKLLDLTEQHNVPTYSAQNLEDFSAWQEWRQTKILPGGQAIDLDSATHYANEFIRKNSANPEQAKSAEISRKLQQAYDLITHIATDQAAMQAQLIRAVMNQHEAELSPISLPAFPEGVTTLALQSVKGTYEGYEIKSMITASRQYFSRIRKGKLPDDSDKAKTITLATLWAEGKSDKQRLQEMKQLAFFDQLDALLDLEKIKHDFNQPV